MKLKSTPSLRLATLACAVSMSSVALAETVTIGTVNNGDMIRMQGLASAFEAAHPGIELEWVILEENVLRQRLTTDIAANSGQFDVMTIGMYEAPIWGGNGWLEPMTGLSASYDVNDIFPAVRGGLSANGELYALPFYGESSMTYYRADLFEAAGLTMPAEPTWEQVRAFARELHNPEQELYGVCLRGKAGWGENMALVTTMVNSFGGSWFDMDWNAQLETEEWKNAINFYVDLLGNYGPPGASSNGFNENLALFNTGKCAMWVDATVAGSFVTDPTQSQVPESVGFAAAPKQVTSKGSGWLWAWALAVPVSSDAKEAAKEFVTWATSKEYSQLVAEHHGIAAIPPGTRHSTYKNQAYLDAAAFADMTLSQMQKADPNDATLNDSPYTGVQFVAIPGFSGFATTVGQQVAGALSGNVSVDQALSNANRVVNREMRRAGYQN